MGRSELRIWSHPIIKGMVRNFGRRMKLKLKLNIINCYLVGSKEKGSIRL